MTRHMRANGWAGRMALGWAWVLLTAATCVAAGPGRTQLDLLHEQHEQRHDRFARDLGELAQFCEQNGYLEARRMLEELALPLDEQAADVDALPESIQPSLPRTLPSVELQWRAKLRKLREEYAQDLYLLSRRALRSNNVSFAFDLVREVAFHAPDHPQARMLLGYVRHKDQWVTPFEAANLRKGYVDHPQFGWLPRTHVARYEAGERYFRGNWIAAEKEAAIRRGFEYAWEVESDHFRVKTNVSLEAGVALSRALEQYHRFFMREFAGFYNSPQQVEKLFEGGAAGRTNYTRPYEVHFYATQDEYLRAVTPKMPRAAISRGVYLPSERTSYFFDLELDDEPDAALETLYHEACHQLMYESQRTNREIGETGGFWCVEGIACYLESFEPAEGRLRAGNIMHTRMQWARHRILAEEWYIPLAKFAAMTTQEFQTGAEEELQRRYSQATGLSHFFMNYDDGRYKDAFVNYMAEIFQPRTRRGQPTASLEQLTGMTYEELDRQYLDYIGEMAVQAGELGASAR